MDFSKMDRGDSNKYFKIERELQDYLDYFRTNTDSYPDIHIPMRFMSNVDFIEGIIKSNIWIYQMKFDAKAFEKALEGNEKFAHKCPRKLINDIIKTEEDCNFFLKANCENISIINIALMSDKCLLNYIKNNAISAQIAMLIPNNRYTKELIEEMAKNDVYICENKALAKVGLNTQEYFDYLATRNEYIKNYFCYSTPPKFITEEALMKYVSLTGRIPNIQFAIPKSVMDAAIRANPLNLTSRETDRNIIFEAINKDYKAFDKLNDYPDDEIRVAALLNMESFLL